MQILVKLGVLGTFPRLLWFTLNLEPYTLGVIIIMFISNSTIQLTIFLLHTLIQTLKLNMQSSSYLNPHDILETIRYRFYLMWHFLAPNVPVQHVLQHVQYASYQSVWQPRWTRQHNQPHHADICSVLESPTHIHEQEDVISIVEALSAS